MIVRTSRNTFQAHSVVELPVNDRGIQVSGSYSYARIFAILKNAFPEHAAMFPVIENEGLPLRPTFINDCSKAEKELGMRWRSLEETVVSAARKLFELEASHG